MSEDRTALVVLRGGHSHLSESSLPQSEVVKGVAKWSTTSLESLELYSSANELVATFRDWSFVKFLEDKH